ncbi:hypothetical protein MLD38_027351 [Melastoma candidum]|uniref:Uncharacterized protein n=1 Tax=Melastoma candidum TaxID=119954 RepID=A0ACB9P490_9MYRT|nr:hypothetical protein MLD38_027351 [Melastoma candidum]
MASASGTRDLDKLLLRPGHLVGPNFVPGPELRDDLGETWCCPGSKTWTSSTIDMDRIEVTNINRQFLFRSLEDVDKPKAMVAAKHIMERVSGVDIVPHFCRIEEEELEFYSNFGIIVLVLDSNEARNFINAVAYSFLEYHSDGNPREETMKPTVDGGTEGFKGRARVILPGITPCFECIIWLFPPQVKFPL